MKFTLSQHLGTAAIVAGILAAGSLSVSAFQYTNENALVVFRQGGGAYELVVNAGPVSNLVALTAGQHINLPVSASQLATAFPSLNDLSFSVMSCNRTNGASANPLTTLWLTRPRSDFNTQTTPWERRGVSGQGNTASPIDSIGINARQYSDVVGAGPNNTGNNILVDSGSNLRPGVLLGIAGNFNTFQGDVETTTSSTFDSDGQPARADFYRMTPDLNSTSHNPGTYLGYFDFNDAGILQYTAGPSSTVVTAPTDLSIARQGTTNIVSFTGIAGLHYDLSFTNSDGLLAPATMWPALGSSVLSGGGTMSLTNVSASGNLFFRIKVTP